MGWEHKDPPGVEYRDRSVLELVESDQKHLLWLSGESEVSRDKTKGFYTPFNF